MSSAFTMNLYLRKFTVFVIFFTVIYRKLVSQYTSTQKYKYQNIRRQTNNFWTYAVDAK